MFYPRRIYPELLEHLQKPEVTAITGMRRTGKTVLLNRLFSEIKTTNKLLIDLESRVNRELFTISDYDDIWRELQRKYVLREDQKVYIFLDEIQYLPTLTSVIKYFYDHYQVKFIVTGSSSFYLKDLFSESLAGRKRIFELFPLTFDEFLVFKGKLPQPDTSIFDLLKIKKSEAEQKLYGLYFQEYLRFGAFPQVVLENNLETKTVLLKDILYSYIDTDVKNLSRFKRITDMEKLILLLSGRIGQKLDISKISREIPLARRTVMEYLGFLEKTYCIFLVHQYSGSSDRQLSKAPKLYFCDTGLANILSQISSGQILENAIFHALRVKYESIHAFSRINYYQRRSGAEIDFILDNQIALEVKERGNDYDLKRLRDFAQKIGIRQYRLISQNQTTADYTIYASQL